MGSHHEVLGVSSDAERAEIRRAYRDLLKDHHPDQGGDRAQFLRIKAAYEELTGESPPGHYERRDGVAGDEATFDPDERGASAFGAGLSVRGTFLTVTLSGLVHDLELASLIDDPGLGPDVERTVAFFELHNTSDRVLPWRGREQTSFIGDDGFMYDASNIVRPHAEKLPGRWSGTAVDVGAGRALEAIVIAQEMPPDVAIEQVVYTQHATDPQNGSGDETERYLFEIRPRIRDTLDQVPFDLE